MLFLIFLTIFHFNGGRSEYASIPRPPWGKRTLITRRFAKIPDWGGTRARIVGIVHWKQFLYITTSVSGGIIHKISPSGNVVSWFNVVDALRLKNRNVEMGNSYHGGVRGLAFHPQHSKNGLLYISLLESRNGSPSDYRYMSFPDDAEQADSVVYEWRVDKNSRRPIATSAREVIRVGLRHYDHPIKQMAFKGNLLYISHGDGSEQSATFGGGMNNDGLGKILRINPLKRGSNPYSIPPNNPFVKSKRYKPEIFALGLRNPHTLCFSRRKGTLFVGDSGRDNAEEINIIRPGGNYGWPEREGPFVHRKSGGGLGNGVSKLPADDAKFNYIYPSAALGHFGERGWDFNRAGQAIAASCPIENGSKLTGLLLYTNFPTDGAVYYSTLGSLRSAVVKGPPKSLRRAKTFRMKILFDHDGNGNTNPLQMDDLRGVVQKDRPGEYRADVRFGRGSRGEIYWSSKSSGWIYLITNSVPRKK